MPLCFCLDDTPGVWLYFRGACADSFAQILPLQMTKKEIEATVTKIAPVIGFITVIILTSNEVFLGNWNGATVSLTIENHDLGIQFCKWFDTGHYFKVDSDCTSLPNDPLSFVSDALTSFKKIAKRRRGLIAMSCFELVSNMECTPVFGFPMLLSTDCATNGNICHSDSI